MALVTHGCKSFKRAGVGTNGILACKFLSKNADRTLGDQPFIVQIIPAVLCGRVEFAVGMEEFMVSASHPPSRSYLQCCVAGFTVRMDEFMVRMDEFMVRMVEFMVSTSHPHIKIMPSVLCGRVYG
jgi:hypothetical protein